MRTVRINVYMDRESDRDQFEPQARASKNTENFNFNSLTAIK